MDNVPSVRPPPPYPVSCRQLFYNFIFTSVSVGVLCTTRMSMCAFRSLWLRCRGLGKQGSSRHNCGLRSEVWGP